MNHRLDELYEQAYEQKPLMVANPETFEIEHKVGNGGRLMYTREFNKEKFAELIIKECANVGSRSMYPDTDPDYVGRKIKQHFGVEE